MSCRFGGATHPLARSLPLLPLRASGTRSAQFSEDDDASIDAVHTMRLSTLEEAADVPPGSVDGWDGAFETIKAYMEQVRISLRDSSYETFVAMNVWVPLVGALFSNGSAAHPYVQLANVAVCLGAFVHKLAAHLSYVSDSDTRMRYFDKLFTWTLDGFKRMLSNQQTDVLLRRVCKLANVLQESMTHTTTFKASLKQKAMYLVEFDDDEAPAPAVTLSNFERHGLRSLPFSSSSTFADAIRHDGWLRSQLSGDIIIVTHVEPPGLPSDRNQGPYKTVWYDYSTKYHKHVREAAERLVSRQSEIVELEYVLTSLCLWHTRAITACAVVEETRSCASAPTDEGTVNHADAIKSHIQRVGDFYVLNRRAYYARMVKGIRGLVDHPKHGFLMRTHASWVVLNAAIENCSLPHMRNTYLISANAYATKKISLNDLLALLWDLGGERTD